MEEQDDNRRFFDHRREWARTDFENDGLPRPEWEQLLAEVRRRADAAGFYRYSLPKDLGGSDGSNAAMAAVREHLAHRGLGLHNDLQNEHSVVGNLVFAHLVHLFGTEAQREALVEGVITGSKGLTFGLTEPEHGSDATWLETTTRRVGDDWVINGAKRWNTGIHTASHALHFRADVRRARLGEGVHRFPRAHRRAGFRGPLLLVDVQHAHRPRGDPASRRSRACVGGVRRGG